MKNNLRFIIIICGIFWGCGAHDENYATEEKVSQKEAQRDAQVTHTNAVPSSSAVQKTLQDTHAADMDKVYAHADAFDALLHPREEEKAEETEIFEWRALNSETAILAWAQHAFYNTRTQPLAFSNTIFALAFLTNSIDKNVSSMALRFFGILHARAGDFEEAEHIYNYILSRYSDIETLTERERGILFGLLFDMIRLSDMKGDAEEQIQRTQYMIDLQGSEVHPHLFEELAFAYMNNGDRDQAIEAATKAIELYNERGIDPSFLEEFLDDWEKGGAQSRKGRL